MSRIGVAVGPSTGLPGAFLPKASNDGPSAAGRAAQTAVVAASARVIPTKATVGHPISEGWDATLRERIATQA